MMTNMSNFQEYEKLIQEQMAYENRHHDEHFPALVASTKVPKLKNVVDSGVFLFFGDQNADDGDADDDDVAADIANADDDETGCSCAASFS